MCKLLFTSHDASISTRKIYKKRVAATCTIIYSCVQCPQTTYKVTIRICSQQWWISWSLA